MFKSCITQLCIIFSSLYFSPLVGLSQIDFSSLISKIEKHPNEFIKEKKENRLYLKLENLFITDKGLTGITYQGEEIPIGIFCVDNFGYYLPNAKVSPALWDERSGSTLRGYCPNHGEVDINCFGECPYCHKELYKGEPMPERKKQPSPRDDDGSSDDE